MKIKLPEYISQNDLDCNCGCGIFIIDVRLIEMIVGLTNYIRNNYGMDAYPVFHSMTRCEKYDASLKSNSKYQTHRKGMGCDLHYANFPIYKLHELASSVHHKGNILDGGLGYYDWGIHMDSGPLRTWGAKIQFLEAKKERKSFGSFISSIFQWRTA